MNEPRSAKATVWPACAPLPRARTPSDRAITAAEVVEGDRSSRNFGLVPKVRGYAAHKKALVPHLRAVDSTDRRLLTTGPTLASLPLPGSTLHGTEEGKPHSSILR